MAGQVRPDAWSWDDQVKKGDKGDAWTGVRNHTAKLNLAKMKKGDRAFFYHSGESRSVVGICRGRPGELSGPDRKPRRSVGAVDVRALARPWPVR